MITRLKFINQHSDPEVVEIHLARPSDAATIMDWYGAYFGGDDYVVEINGRRVPIDQNGSYDAGMIDASANT